MPYQNGRQIRGYLRKRKHKLRLKSKWRRVACIRYALGYIYDKPYKQLYRSGTKKVLRRQTNKRLRQKLGDDLPWATADYRRVFDYWWELD